MENKIGRTIVLLLMVLWAFSCKRNTFENVKSLTGFLENPTNKLRYHKNVNGVDFFLTYRPTDMLVHQELGPKYSKEQVKQLRNTYGKNIYFNLEMGMAGKELLDWKTVNKTEFTSLINRLAFGMGDNVHLVRGKDEKVPLLDFSYSRYYGMGKNTNILLAFEIDSNSIGDEDLRLIIKDIGFGTGDVAFNLNAQSISDQPELEFSPQLN